MPTMTEALAAMRVRLDEPVAAQWSDADLRRWLAEGQRDIARRTKCFEKTASLAVTANNRFVTAPSDLLTDGIRAAYFTSTSSYAVTSTTSTQLHPLEYTNIKSLDHAWIMNQAQDKAHRPSMFTMWGMVPTASFILYPVPQVAGSLILYYFRAAIDPWASNYTSASNDSSSLDVPLGWEDAVYEYAEYNALRKDNSPRWQDAFSLYEKKIQNLMYATQTHSDQPSFITPYRTPAPPWGMGRFGYGGF
jgi:hypothetical protein